ncbi:CPBP family intramembrane glutamic endopeptidase [Phaeocystidibacter luteus]|uniref:CPBP family intramembrane metalloprotease n=1 Tax=Phaeocystidibacter luteus TaxID=911197 RepID=A0A6N6RK16_9FLAO|nr:CPBP family intramembrane glutamic endopeptidase [Phaeocystidibacter luteus]KAB2808631.1 CPBP family intramembrane metalloprotease [Phaeocystidibacter luteus]
MFGLYQSLSETALLLILGLGILGYQGKSADISKMLIAVISFFMYKSILYEGFGLLSFPDVIPGKYNWEGKLASLVLLVLISFLAFGKDWDGVGWTRKIQNKKKTWTVTGVLFVLYGLYALFYLSGRIQEDANSFLYQISMPGFSEEWMYRGVLFALLIPTAEAQKKEFWPAAIAITLLFAFTHAFRITGEVELTFNTGNFIYALVTGSAFMYLRVLSGSLWVPILLHAWFNAAGYFL